MYISCRIVDANIVNTYMFLQGTSVFKAFAAIFALELRLLAVNQLVFCKISFELKTFATVFTLERTLVAVN